MNSIIRLSYLQQQQNKRKGKERKENCNTPLEGIYFSDLHPNSLWKFNEFLNPSAILSEANACLSFGILCVQGEQSARSVS